jgi:hypothetical protein
MTIVSIFPLVLLAIGIWSVFNNKGSNKFAYFILLHVISALLIVLYSWTFGDSEMIKYWNFKQVFYLALVWPILAPVMLWGIGVVAWGLAASIIMVIIGVIIEISLYYVFYKISIFVDRKVKMLTSR